MLRVENASLLHAPLTPGLRPACAERLLEALPYAARLRLERAGAPARAASLAGLALALIAAVRANGNKLRGVADLQLSDGERPRFRRGPHFSISHTDTRVACIACATGEVGLDIETGQEERALAPCFDKLRRWTAAEATLKAAGAGLRRIRDVRVDLVALASELDGKHYVLSEIELAPATLGHVASLRPIVVAIECVALDGREFSASLERVLGLTAQGQQ